MHNRAQALAGVSALLSATLAQNVSYVGGVFADIYLDAGIVPRLEYAKGKSDNEAYYLNLGHPF